MSNKDRKYARLINSNSPDKREAAILSSKIRENKDGTFEATFDDTNVEVNWQLADLSLDSRGRVLPNADDIAVIKPGDWCKLCFVPLSPQVTDGEEREFIWVRVTIASRGVFTGSIDNHPVKWYMRDTPIGSIIAFESKHIADILEEDEIEFAVERKGWRR